MKQELKAYIIEKCNGPYGCPNAVDPSSGLADMLLDMLENSGLDDFIQGNISGRIRRHKSFVVSISSCPNSCSRPQIADIGFIGAVSVKRYEDSCTHCNACVDACPEEAIVVDKERGPIIFDEKCLLCGRCVRACPAEALQTDKRGYRIQLGGRLGRHPRLATELPGIYSEDESLEITKNCLNLFMENYNRVKRFADLFSLFEREELIGMVLK